MAWSKNKPASTTSLAASNPQMLANNDALEIALNREHEFSTGGTVADQVHHKKGSARCFIQASAPTVRRDTNAFTAEDNGSLWIDTDSSPVNQFNVLTAFAGPTWTPISTEVIAVLLAANRVFAGTLGVTGDFAVNTDKFTVAGATGNTLVAGTFDSTGIATLADASLLKTTAAPGADAQIANKKYVDDQVTAAKAAVGWVHDGSTTISLITLTTTFQDVDTGIGGRGIAFLKVKPTQNLCTIFFKTKGEADTESGQTSESMGCTAGRAESGRFFYVWCETDASGFVQAKRVAGTDSNVTVVVMGSLLTP